jgi:hypothetical protein
MRFKRENFVYIWTEAVSIWGTTNKNSHAAL